MKLALLLLLALLGGFVAGWIYSLVFGAAYSILPAGPLHRWRYHNRLYLHFVWFSRQFITTFVSCALLTIFGVAIFDAAVSWPLIFLLSITPAFVFFSQRLRRSENLGYFNLFVPDETKFAESERFIVITNRLEAVSRIVGLFSALGVARLTLLN